MIYFLFIMTGFLCGLAWILFLRVNDLNKTINEDRQRTLEYVGTLTARMNQISPLIELRPEDIVELH